MESNKLTKENTSHEENEKMTGTEKIVASVIITLIGVSLFYFGGWDLIFAEKSSILSYITNNKGLVFVEEGILIRINRAYYGFVKDTPFFDSPIIQWIMLIFSLGAFSWALQILFFGKIIDNDDNE